MHVISGSTQVLGVLGDPISHTASPVLHNTQLRQLGLDYVYVPFLVHAPQLSAAMAGLKALNIRGCNVTVPHKETVIPFLDELDPKAKALGAVNTIINHEGRLIGYNTDGEGFLMSLSAQLNIIPHDKRVCVLGAGGASRAIVLALQDAGVSSLTIVNRTRERAECLVSDLGFSSVSIMSYDDASLDQVLAGSDWVINTTSVGLGEHGQDSPLQRYDWVSSSTLCIDIIYRPKITALMREVDRRGGCVLGGSGMLAGQALLAFVLFTGHQPSFDEMLSVLETS